MDIRRVAPRDASLAPCSVASLFPPSGVLMPYDRVGRQFQPLGDYVLRDYVRGVHRAASLRVASDSAVAVGRYGLARASLDDPQSVRPFAYQHDVVTLTGDELGESFRVTRVE